MKKFLFILSVFFVSISNLAQSNFSVNIFSQSNSITCANPVVNLIAYSTGSITASSFTWFSQFQAPTSSTSYSTNIPGTYTLAASLGSIVATNTILISSNSITPVSTISSTFQNITCNLSSVTNVTATAISPTINLIQKIIGPSGATFLGTNNPQIYSPQAAGVYTYQLINQINGCSTNKTFTVNSSQGYPSFSLVSSQNFTLGCSSKSFAVIQFSNASATNSNQIPNGGPVSFTVLPFGAGVYTIYTAGNYTAIAVDNITGCEHRAAFTILANQYGPSIDFISVPTKTLNCLMPTTTVSAYYSIPNISSNWLFGASTVSSNSVVVNTNTSLASTTLISNYTLTTVDNGNLCQSTTVIPIYQNISTPVVVAPNNPILIDCISIVNTLNATVTSVPSSVYNYSWTSNPPGSFLTSASNSSVMISGLGNYSLTVIDPLSQCKSAVGYNVSGCIGISENSSLQNLISIQPNPSNGNFVIEKLSDATNSKIEIYNALGMLIKSLNLKDSNNSISLMEQANGIYFIKFFSNQKYLGTEKIIKE